MGFIMINLNDYEVTGETLGDILWVEMQNFMEYEIFENVDDLPLEVISSGIYNILTNAEIGDDIIRLNYD